MTSRESMSFAFRCSVDLARAQDESATLKSQLALLTARLATMTSLVTEAADDLSNCHIGAVDGKTRFLETRIVRAASTLCEALIVAGIELPVDKDDPEVSAQLIEGLSIGGDQAS